MTITDYPVTETSELEAQFLFKEARQRRRRRILVGGLISCATIALVSILSATGGVGHFFGGPPSLSSDRGPTAGPVTHQPSSEGHRSNASRSYPLPSDGWRPGQGVLLAGSGWHFQATLSPSGACTSNDSVDYLWPSGYRVRFHPTELLDPKGRVVARQGQFMTVAGGIVGTASWPAAARCYKGGDVWEVQGPIQVGRRAFVFGEG